uniref:NADH-ubiquinone oxidoreductase chain 4L n=1 Tax=Chilecicada sp. PL492 TaxID=2219938 RepID=A0A3Q8G8F8_9HEMI|nr:NADH dehydrogenase subunit 4L [Chilecicada sp. PL492]
MNLLLMYYLFMYSLGVVSLCLTRKHIILSLLSLEFIILSLFCTFSLMLLKMSSESYMLLIFLIFSVCESVIGLSSLVTMIRSHGNDYLMSISLFTC